MSNRGYFSDGVMPSHDVRIAVGAGKFPGVGFFNVNAKKLNLSQTAKTVLVDFTEDYVFPSEAGESMTVVSDNAADVGNVLQVLGLDENKLAKEQIVTTSGTTPVVLDGLWSRINSCIVVTKEIVGNVTVKGTNTYAVADAESQRASIGVYSSPDNMAVQVLAILPIIVKPGGPDAYLDGQVRVRTAKAGQPLGAFTTPFLYGLRTDGSSSAVINNVVPEAITGSTDFLIEAEATANNVVHYVRMSVLLEALKE